MRPRKKPSGARTAGRRWKMHNYEDYVDFASKRKVSSKMRALGASVEQGSGSGS